MPSNLSIILPAKNEAAGLASLLPRIQEVFPDAEVIVVDDGSIDGTRDVCAQAGVRCLSSPYSMGNGAAIKRGARAASGAVLAFMDADGQHDPWDLKALLEKMSDGFDMVVGARSSEHHASVFRGLANRFYNAIASWVTGAEIRDLTSGLRVVRAPQFIEFIHLLPNGFSYPTTITMAFLRSAYAVCFVPVKVAQRKASVSHIKPFRDGVRFLLIIFKIATLYSPLKLFVPVSFGFFLSGWGYYAYTFATTHRFTNMSALLLTASVVIFLIGLISEQITSLMFSRQSA